MRYTHAVERMTVSRKPLVLIPQYFGSLIFDRRSSRYLPFDHESTAVLRELAGTPFDAVHSHWAQTQSPECVLALERFFEGFEDFGFFTLDGRLAADVLDVVPPSDHLAGPLAVHLEVASTCNLTCTHCFAGDLPRRERNLTLAELNEMFAEMAAMGSFRLGLTGGEPLLRRDLFDIIDLATNHGLCPCVTTNGLLIDERVAREFGQRELVWLNVSLEGATAATNDLVRGTGTFERVVEKLSVLREHARFTLAFTIMKTNLAEIGQCVELAARVGASTAVFRPLYPVGVAARHLELMPTFEEYSRALEEIAASSDDGGFNVRNIDPFSPASRDEGQSVVHANLGCGAGNLVASVSVGGDVNPCSFLGPEFVAGNVRDSSLTRLWHESAGFTGMRGLPGGNPCGCSGAANDAGNSGGRFAGGCRARALVLAGDVNAPDPWIVAHAADGAAHRRPLPLLTVELERQRP